MKNFQFHDFKINDNSAEEENFWPSFADIMMLIVMIFLIIMLFLMAKNWDLVEKLKDSILAEQKIAQEANIKGQQNQILSQENETLSESLSSTENQLSLLRLKLMELQDEKYSTDIKLAEKTDEVDDLKSQIVILGDEVQSLFEKNNAINQLLLSEQEKSNSQKQVIIQLEEYRATAKEEFDALKYKYDRLVKPARSAKGKLVVEVTLLQKSGNRTITVKMPNGSPEVKTELEMHTQLRQFHDSYPGQIYVRIIIPKESVISHNEAWRFTNTLLKRYDYYHQGNTQL